MMSRYLGAHVHDQRVDHGDVVAHAGLLGGQPAVLQEDGEEGEEKDEEIEEDV